MFWEDEWARIGFERDILARLFNKELRRKAALKVFVTLNNNGDYRRTAYCSPTQRR